VVQFHKPEGVDALIAKRVAFLTDYQNVAYAQRYLSCVDKVRRAEATTGKTALTEAVARNLFKLMAYKDEYEVARLHTDAGFLQKINGMFEGDYTLNYHLAPPLIAKTNARWCSWVKGFAAFKRNVSVAYAWEPIIVRGGRRRTRQQHTVRDWHACNITLRRGFTGAKPEGVIRWLLEVWNAEKTDTIDDIFPGSGAVSRALEAWKTERTLWEQNAPADLPRTGDAEQPKALPIEAQRE
jgi:hypothetical protein